MARTGMDSGSILKTVREIPTRVGETNRKNFKKVLKNN